MRSRARMFMFSHMFGPILGNVIPGLLLWLDPRSAPTLAVLAGSICCFWIFPFALKYSARYELLSYLSIQNLLFAILWGCYYYGGLSSPFLPWLVTVPLLAFFYLGASVKSCITILLQISISIGIFVALFSFGGRLPHTIELADMQGVGLVSIMSAAIYVSMMALFYAGILATQSEFEKEVREHIDTATQLRAAATEAERANAAKADFLAKMSHELRTPLNAVIGYSQILLEDTDPESDPQGVDDLNKIHSAGNHLLTLVNAILDLSKIEAGKMEVYRRPVDVPALLRFTVDRWNQDARLKERKISLSAGDAGGLLEIDSEKLEQILASLIDNSVRYAPRSDVRVVANFPNGAGNSKSVTISVSDSGPGISKELMPTLFDTFSDFEVEASNALGGPGLGLPLAHKLCTLVGATLSVRTSPETGTTFTIVFDGPAADTDAATQNSPAFAEAA
jgi:signal transduction histidine kinase